MTLGAVYAPQLVKQFGNSVMTWQKAQSGNPKGRPKKGQTLTEIVRATTLRANEQGVLPAQALADKLLSLANAGDLDAIKYIYDRVDGKPVETQQIGGMNGGPLTLQIVESVIASRNSEDEYLQSASEVPGQ